MTKNNGSDDFDRDRLQLLVDAVVDYAIYMLDLDGRVISWNSGAERLKGYSAERNIGQPFERFYTAGGPRCRHSKAALQTARDTGASTPKAGGCVKMAAGSGRASSRRHTG